MTYPEPTNDNNDRAWCMERLIPIAIVALVLVVIGASIWK